LSRDWQRTSPKAQSPLCFLRRKGSSDHQDQGTAGSQQQIKKKTRYDHSLISFRCFKNSFLMPSSRAAHKLFLNTPDVSIRSRAPALMAYAAKPNLRLHRMHSYITEVTLKKIISSVSLHLGQVGRCLMILTSSRSIVISAGCSFTFLIVGILMILSPLQ
jgi:hypothetical protein